MWCAAPGWRPGAGDGWRACSGWRRWGPCCWDTVTAYTPAATALLTLFFAVVASGQGFRGALDHPAAVWLGQASYSLYLSHGLLIWLVLDRLGGWLDPGHGSAALFLLLAVVTCALLVLVASLLALGVEQPAIAAGRRRALRLPRGRLHPIPGG